MRFVTPTSLALGIAGAFAPLAAAQTSAFNHPDGTTHWYQVFHTPAGMDWSHAHLAAAQAGGHLATITSAAEAAHVFAMVDNPLYWSQNPGDNLWDGPWLGGFQQPNSNEPADDWDWTELDGFTFTDWTAGQPDDDLGIGANRICFGGDPVGRVATWNDRPDHPLLKGYVVEWSGAMFVRTTGLLYDSQATRTGYTLFSSLRRTDTHLIDTRGRLVHHWDTSSLLPGTSTILLPNGDLLRAGRANNPRFTAGGNGGVIEKFDWDGNPVGSPVFPLVVSSPTECQHHDFLVMPNGNLLLMAWELVTGPDAIANGRDPALLPDGELWPEKLIEIDRNTGQRVWEWRAWDHIIQDFDPLKLNHGVVGDHPELIDLNYVIDGGIDDWLHWNAVDYNETLDQIVVSSRSFDEFWIIDHSTDTAEAATHAGGRSGKGGDLLYRWGNPLAYRAGTLADKKLFKQHNSHWIPAGLPGAGNMLVFNNGVARPGGNASSVDEITLPTPDVNGNYPLTPGTAFGPAAATWSYLPNPPFFAPFISGAQRLPSGNTLVCSGTNGIVFEVTPAGGLAWSYSVPMNDTVDVTQGDRVALNQIFRAPHYASDYPAFTGRDLTPSGPIEHYPAALLVEGSPDDYEVRPGESARFELIAEHAPNRTHIMLTSATPGMLPIDFRYARIGYDALVEASITSAAPSVFQNYIGALDANGHATATLAVPDLPFLIGLEFRTMFVIVGPVRAGVVTLSNTVVVRVIP